MGLLYNKIFYLLSLKTINNYRKAKGKRMGELTQEKKEAMEVMGEYLDKLIPGIEELAKELQFDRKPDTDEFLQKCIDGLNWVVEIYNRVSDVINGENVKIDKEDVNPAIMELGEALKSKEDLRIAEALRGVLPFLRKLKGAVTE